MSLYRMNAPLLGLILLILIQSGTSTTVSAQGAPGYPPGADAFVASANALAKSATERVDLGRSSARLDQIRRSLTNKLLVAGSGATVSLADLDEVRLLCGVQRPHIQVAARRNYLQTVAGRIEEVGKPAQIDNLIGAAKSLFNSQSLDIRGPVTNQTQLDTLAKNIENRCANDIKGADKQFYLASIVEPQLGTTSAADEEVIGTTALLGAFSSIINVFVGIITPAVIEGAKLIDEQSRRNAIRRFLSDEGHREEIRRNGDSLATEVGVFIENKRGRLTGAFLEKLALLRKSEISLPKIDACKALETNRFTKRQSGAANDDFAICWRAVWTQLEAPVAAALKSADEYDTLADAGDKNNAKAAFADLSEALSGISENAITNPHELWQIATRLMAIGEKVQAATSKESREKIQKAIDELVKAL